MNKEDIGKFWDSVGKTPDTIPEFKLPDLQGQYPMEEYFQNRMEITERRTDEHIHDEHAS